MNAKLIAEKAYDYLLEGCNGEKEKLDYYLEYYKYSKVSSLKGVFREMLHHATQKQGSPNFIGGIENLEAVLFSFNPKEVVQVYGKWDKVFDAIAESDYVTPSKMDRENNRNTWVQFSKTIMAIARFLDRFDQYEEFEKYVNQFLVKENPDLRIGLPLIISSEIHGYGFALACSFLKEVVSPGFIKPDTHVNYIAVNLGIADQEDSDYRIYSKLVAFSEEANKEPYWIDRAFFLIGRGSFFKTKRYPNEDTINCSKTEFVQIIKNISK